jgi:hypothetical protein
MRLVDGGLVLGTKVDGLLCDFDRCISGWPMGHARVVGLFVDGGECMAAHPVCGMGAPVYPLFPGAAVCVAGPQMAFPGQNPGAVGGIAHLCPVLQPDISFVSLCGGLLQLSFVVLTKMASKPNGVWVLFSFGWV